MAAYYFIPKQLINRLPFLQKAAYWLESLVFRLAINAMRPLTHEQCTMLLSRVFGIFGPYTGKAAKVRQNLSFVIPDSDDQQREQVLKQIFANLGHATAELIKMETLWQDRDRRLEFVAEGEAEAVLKTRKPIVFASAHIGAWQVATLIGAYYGVLVSTVYARESNPYMAECFYRLRRGFKTRLVSSEGSVGDLLKELRQGHSVGLAVDTRLDAGEMIPFFGIPAPTNTVAARLALKFNCNLIPVRAQRLEGGRFRILSYSPIKPPDSGFSRREQAMAMTEELNLMFESWIKEDPGQWMCLKRRWPKDADPKTRNDVSSASSMPRATR